MGLQAGGLWSLQSYDEQKICLDINSQQFINS